MLFIGIDDISTIVVVNDIKSFMCILERVYYVCTIYIRLLEVVCVCRSSFSSLFNNDRRSQICEQHFPDHLKQPRKWNEDDDNDIYTPNTYSTTRMITF